MRSHVLWTDTVIWMVCLAEDGAPPAGKVEGNRLGVKHYLSKPFDPGLIVPAVNVALREAKAIRGEVGKAGTAREKGPGDTRRKKRGQPRGLIGNKEMRLDLERQLPGGIPLGSLTFVEGGGEAVGSVLCQHIAFGGLALGHGVAYLTSHGTLKELSLGMGALGMGVSNFLGLEKLRVIPLEPWRIELSAERYQGSLTEYIEKLPEVFEVVVVTG